MCIETLCVRARAPVCVSGGTFEDKDAVTHNIEELRRLEGEDDGGGTRCRDGEEVRARM